MAPASLATAAADWTTRRWPSSSMRWMRRRRRGERRRSRLSREEGVTGAAARDDGGALHVGRPPVQPTQSSRGEEDRWAGGRFGRPWLRHSVLPSCQEEEEEKKEEKDETQLLSLTSLTILFLLLSPAVLIRSLSVVWAGWRYWILQSCSTDLFFHASLVCVCVVRVQEIGV